MTSAFDTMRAKYSQQRQLAGGTSEWPLSRVLTDTKMKQKTFRTNSLFIVESPPGFCLSHFSENWSLLHSENILLEEEPKLRVLKIICDVRCFSKTTFKPKQEGVWI